MLIKNSPSLGVAIKGKHSAIQFRTVSTTVQNNKKRKNISYNLRQKSRHTFPRLQYLSGQFISSPRSPQFNVVYRDEVVIARLQHCRGERAFPILMMSLGIVPKIPCQRIVVLSDPGVPRTFVEDCSKLCVDDNLPRSFRCSNVGKKKPNIHASLINV